MHLHSDRFIDLLQLVVASWHQDYLRRQQVFGPAVMTGFAGGTIALWRPELELRIAHERWPSIEPLQLELTEFKQGVIFGEHGVPLDAVAVDHRPVAPAYGFMVPAGATGSWSVAVLGAARR